MIPDGALDGPAEPAVLADLISKLRAGPSDAKNSDWAILFHGDITGVVPAPPRPACAPTSPTPATSTSTSSTGNPNSACGAPTTPGRTPRPSRRVKKHAKTEAKRRERLEKTAKFLDDAILNGSKYKISKSFRKALYWDIVYCIRDEARVSFTANVYTNLLRMRDLLKSYKERGLVSPNFPEVQLAPVLDLHRRFVPVSMIGLHYLLKYHGVELARKSPGSAEKVFVDVDGRRKFKNLGKAEVAKETWDRILWSASEVLKQKVVYRKVPDGSLVNKFNGEIKTDGYAVRVTDYLNGIRPKTQGVATGRPRATAKKRVPLETDPDYVAFDPLMQPLATEPAPPDGPDAGMKIHLGLIEVRVGQLVVVMDPGVKNQYVAFIATTKIIEALKYLKSLVEFSLTINDPQYKTDVAEYVRQRVHLLAKSRALFRSCSSRHFHHEVRTYLLTRRTKMWRARRGLPALDAALSRARASGDLGNYTSVMTKVLPRYLDYALDRRVARLKFFAECSRRQWWDDLALELKDAVVLVGRNFGNFGIISAGPRGPIVEMVKNLRRRRVDVYLVNENYSSKRCAVCAFARPNEAKNGDCDMVHPPSAPHATLMCASACRDQRQRDTNAALNILCMNLDKLVLVDDPAAAPSTV
ncbi:hypothetical protein H9P43_004874 [Blastocladiella emersonii ATCC 22665]|nr:hypothetical protein H9P43_004874 [Blastocladiella emersonii ATCC 22665]